MQERRFRVAQWGTGHTGMHSLRKVVEHPRFDLVGVYVYSDEKAGRDAGDLCGIESTGVVATRKIEEIIAAEPDCVMFMPMWPGPVAEGRDEAERGIVADLCRLLESGANVVTTVTAFHHPPTMDPETREQIEASCRRGGTSLFDTGGAPGFITEAFPITALLMERRVDRVSVVQYADVSARNSPTMIAELFGMDPAAADPSTIGTHSVVSDGDGLRQLGDAIGLPIDDVTVDVTFALATKKTDVLVATIEAGTVGAWRMDVRGLRGGKPLLEYTRTFFVARDLDPDWKVRDTGWHVAIEGDAPLDIEIRFPPPEIYNPLSPGYNANLPLNSVPAVCDGGARHPGHRGSAVDPVLLLRPSSS